MSRRGLTPQVVVDAAADIADRDGLPAVTLAAVAAALGVRTPSLYNHVGGLPGLQRDLAVRAVQQLGEELAQAAVGRAGGDAVRAMATAYRAFARAHPGLYAATVPAPDPGDDDLVAAAEEVVQTVLAVLRQHREAGAAGDDRGIHAVRALRSVLHGFVSIELSGGFGLDVSVDESFRWLLDTHLAGMDAEVETPGPVHQLEPTPPSAAPP